MELDKIQKLLEKYFEATTTVAEEEQLRDYFSSDSVAPEHHQFKDLFTFYEVSRNMTSETSFDAGTQSSDDIDDLMDKYWNAETTLEEEQNLRTYFAGNQVAEKHLPFKDMFGMFTTLAQESTDIDLSTVLSAAEVLTLY